MAEHQLQRTAQIVAYPVFTEFRDSSGVEFFRALGRAPRYRDLNSARVIELADVTLPVTVTKEVATQ